jgi:hypothetical protein
MADKIIVTVILKEFNRKVFSHFHSLVKILVSAVLRGRGVLTRRFKELL